MSSETSTAIRALSPELRATVARVAESRSEASTGREGAFWGALARDVLVAELGGTSSNLYAAAADLTRLERRHLAGLACAMRDRPGVDPAEAALWAAVACDILEAGDFERDVLAGLDYVPGVEVFDLPAGA